MKKLAISTFALLIFAACGVTTGPGNKQDVNDKIEQQHYQNNQMDDRVNDQQWDNNQYDNNLNRRKLKDNQNFDNNNTNNLGPNNENLDDRNLVR